MITINIAELKQLRTNYNTENLDQFTERINALTTRDSDWKAKTITRYKLAIEKNQETLAAFDKVMACLDKNMFLPPDSHGGDFDKCAIWNGALLFVPENPETYQISVPQYGRENALINLKG